MPRRPERKKASSGAAPDLAGAELEVRRRQRLSTVERFRQGRTPLQVVAVVEDAVTGAEAAVEDARTRHPPRTPLACREGCAWCCYQRVGTAAPEVFRLVAYLRSTLSSEQWSALLQRVGQRAAARRAAQRAPLPCVLLADDRCMAYQARPLTCRGYNSSNAHLCERALTPGAAVEIPLYAPQKRLPTFVLDGLRAGAVESGLDGTLLELTAALEVALTTPDAEQRWLAGEALFAPARLD
jgi:Fe-S-cluster containining protein